MRRDSTVFSRKSSAFGDNFQTVPWLEAVCNIYLRGHQLPASFLDWQMAKLQVSLIACRQGFLGIFQKHLYSILRVPKHAFASLWDIFVSLAEILPGPGSLCFALAGISSFIAALILLGLEKALSEVAMLAQWNRRILEMVIELRNLMLISPSSSTLPVSLSLSLSLSLWNFQEEQKTSIYHIFLHDVGHDYSIVCNSIVQYSIVQYSMIQYSLVSYPTL